MKPLIHISAKPSHYNKEAASYDAFNEVNSKQLNQVIEKFLKHYKAKTVLDLTCGTGSQVFWLSKNGYEVVGVDINARMLKIAKEKGKKEKISSKFVKGDMRAIKVGKFDAVLTIFNAIGHLTKSDFELTIKNIKYNLNEGGLYIFDIFNLNYLRYENNITRLTIDWQKTVEDTKVREIQYSTISQDGVLASYDTYIEEKDSNTKISRCSQTLQVYTEDQLRDMLETNGFKVLHRCGVDGSEFNDYTTERIVIVAKKV